MFELNPGSPEAIEAGCTCPVMDNGHGRGIIIDGKQQFWMNSDCPLHSFKVDSPWIDTPEPNAT